MNDEHVSIDEIGANLVDFSMDAEISARGLVTKLFPYIYKASKRMSTRAISKYLQEEHHVKLSAASIAKALREPNKHAEAYADEVEPAARAVAEAWDLSVGDVLNNEDAFRHFTRESPKISTANDETDSISRALNECEGARDFIETQWYGQDARFRNIVLQFIQLEEDKDETKEGKSTHE